MTLGPRSRTSPLSSLILSSKSAIARPHVVATVTASSSDRHIVPKPLASVSPYAVSTMSKSNSVCMRSISTTGTVAAPVTAKRSEVRSNSPRFG